MSSGTRWHDLMLMVCIALVLHAAFDIHGASCLRLRLGTRLSRYLIIVMRCV